jgi:dTMP kinase
MGTERAGTLIALEGIDGCGKSLQALRLVDALRAAGRDAVLFREPGDSVHGDELRRIFVDGRDVAPREELDLFIADRRIDVRENILPGLEAGRTVVMDRYYLSSVAYQGSLGIDPEEIRRENEAFAPRPDLTIVLDLAPDVGRARIRSSRGATDSFEDEDYLARVRGVYRGYCERCDDIVCVDASGPAESVHEAILEIVRDRLESATR